MEHPLASMTDLTPQLKLELVCHRTFSGPVWQVVRPPVRDVLILLRRAATESVVTEISSSSSHKTRVSLDSGL